MCTCMKKTGEGGGGEGLCVCACSDVMTKAQKGLHAGLEVAPEELKPAGASACNEVHYAYHYETTLT